MNHNSRRESALIKWSGLTSAAAQFMGRMTLRMTFPAPFAVLVILVFFTLTAKAESTNALSDGEIQGRVLAQKILSQMPAQNYTNTGVLRVRGGDDHLSKFPVKCDTIATPAFWEQIYEAGLTNPVTLVVIHPQSGANVYFCSSNHVQPSVGDIPASLSDAELMSPFAGSDFWFCDLGLEFFHWPQQKVLKKEFYNNCSCAVLESTNPHPSANSYSLVVSWIDEDSLGIVKAFAYDANGKQLKYFHPKSLEKVNGQYQVKSMIMENSQTDSQSVMEFDLDK